MVQLLLALLLAAGCAFAQEGRVVTCRRCSNHGTLPCPKHDKMLERERPAKGTLFCSVAAECQTCGGALAIDCRRCANAAAEAALGARRELVSAWLCERRAQVDAVTDNQPLMHLQTQHCELTFSIRPLTVGRTKLDTHALMHLYGERIEALHQVFRDRLELAAADLPGALQIYMFRDHQDHLKLGPRVTGIGTSNASGVKLMGVDCIYCMWQDPRLVPNDEALHRTIVHNVTHLLVSNMVESNWLGNRKQGWIDAGLAHWFEDSITGKCTNFCFEEVLMQTVSSFKGGTWRTPVRKMVDAGSAVSFAELSQRNTDQLTFEEHAVAFAYVDFLLAAHGGSRLRDLLRLVKRDVPTRDALQKVYGLNPLSIEEAFEAWVKENYSLRPQR